MLTNKLMGAFAPEKTYIEDVFSTYLYTGNGSTQTINNGIDLAGKGGLVWIKSRNYAGDNPINGIPPDNHTIFDTARTNQNALCTSSSIAQDTTWGSGYFNFLSDGFNTGTNAGNNYTQKVGANYVSWTFREAPKFFDVVTYTGDGTSNRSINHSLGVAPGMIIVRSTTSSENWNVYQRSITNPLDNILFLNSASATTNLSGYWGSTAPTSTTFNVGSYSGVNQSGQTYVAYLYAHDTSSTGMIQCGSFTKDGSGNATVTLGWEPQYILTKSVNGGGSAAGDNWIIADIMRGADYYNTPYLYANGASAELTNGGPFFVPTATGFTITGLSGGSDQIYMAVRRGPMATPSDPTKVFDINTFAYSGTPYRSYSDFVTDMSIDKGYAGTFGVSNWQWQERLSGPPNYMKSNSDAAQSTNSNLGFDYNDGVSFNNSVSVSSGSDNVHYQFKRAPGFFDFVIAPYAAGPVSHNLGVVPELVIVKQTTNANSWYAWTTPFTTSEFMTVNTTNGKGSFGYPIWATQTATQTGFLNLGISSPAAFYLFATCPGVSKVGSYTGTGSTQTISCGFTGGARFVLIKRTDNTGDWYVWDTARGIVAGNDPHLSLNTTAAEVTTNDTIDPDSTGFIVNQVAATNVNVNAATYIYMAIA